MPVKAFPAVNLNDTVPAAPSGYLNVNWQVDDPTSPTPNVSAYLKTLATNITSPVDQNLLSYDSASGEWINSTAAALGLALLVSPTFSGTPTAPTASVDTNTTQIATTGFVIGQLSASGDGTPAMNGSASRGVSTHGARADHVHPTDTSREATANKDAASGYAGLDGSTLLKAAEFPAFTGDVSKSAGSLATVVTALQGNAVDSTSLGSTQDGYVLTWSNSSSKWVAQHTSGGSGTSATGASLQRFATTNFSGTTLALTPAFDTATNSSVWSSATYVSGQIPGGGTEYYDGSGANSLAGVYSNTSGHSNWGSGSNLSLQVTMCAYTRVNTDIRWWVGWCTATAPQTTFGASDTPSGSYAAIRYSTIAGDTYFTCITSDGSGTKTTVTTTAPSNQVFYKFQVVFNDSVPNVTFYINGTQVAQHTTHLPTNSAGTAMFWMAGMSRVTTSLHALINNVTIVGN